MVYLGGISGYIWMIKGYFDTIPASMEESARIDGASQFQTFVQILLPISLPIFAVVFILSFISFMSEYPVASIVLQARNNWTLAVGANSFLPENEQLWGRFAALGGPKRRANYGHVPGLPEVYCRRSNLWRRERINCS